MREVVWGACAVIKNTDDDYVLQLRGDEPGIANPGKISLFGGQEDPEDQRDSGSTIKREMWEELELDLNAPGLSVKFLGKKFMSSEVHDRNAWVYIYEVRGVKDSLLVLHEGQAIITVSRGDLAKALNNGGCLSYGQLTAGAQEILKDYLKNNQ